VRSSRYADRTLFIGRIKSLITEEKVIIPPELGR
jgi:hypothetical protein